MEFLNDHHLCDAVLILSFISFAIGKTLSVVGEKGNMCICTLPAPEHLLAVAENAIVWRWGNIFMGAAWVSQFGQLSAQYQSLSHLVADDVGGAAGRLGHKRASRSGISPSVATGAPASAPSMCRMSRC
jgi:hypothetical protein